MYKEFIDKEIDKKVNVVYSATDISTGALKPHQTGIYWDGKQLWEILH